MAQLIDDLLAFIRLGRQELHKQTVFPTRLTWEVWDNLQSESNRQHADISIPKNLPTCEADPDLLRQVFAHLLGNALKYSSVRDKPIIEVGWQQQEDGTVYFVRDNGVGFDIQYANKLFGVFQPLHQIDEFEGTGVGLAIVHRIITRHGGLVWAEAEVGKGATFYFTL
jgi:light-regulated signal transduction histidine kinase (bacteriophytochrome)